MKQTEHLVLTPFNFTLNPLNDEWMEKRWQIFMDVTYPSFMAQTVMDFKWIIGFSHLTLPKWRQKIDALKGIYPIYLENHRVGWPGIAKQYQNQKYLLTTRTDCDDAVANTAIETYQSAVLNNKQSRYISFRNGLITDGVSVYHMGFKSNSFASRLEHSIIAKTVAEHTHPDFCTTHYYEDVINVFPLWMIYIHGGNIGWTMKAAKEHPSCHIHRTPVSKNVFDSFNTNLKYENMKHDE